MRLVWNRDLIIWMSVIQRPDCSLKRFYRAFASIAFRTVTRSNRFSIFTAPSSCGSNLSFTCLRSSHHQSSGCATERGTSDFDSLSPQEIVRVPRVRRSAVRFASCKSTLVDPERDNPHDRNQHALYHRDQFHLVPMGLGTRHPGGTGLSGKRSRTKRWKKSKGYAPSRVPYTENGDYASVERLRKVISKVLG